MTSLEALARAAESLEPLPQTVVSLIGLFSKEAWGPDDVQAIVELDGALTARLLRSANSAQHSGHERVASLERAVVRLGSQSVIQIAVGTAVRSSMRLGIEELGVGEGDFFRHSVTTALATELLALVCTRRLPPEAFTAALLHDIGWLALARELEGEMFERLVARYEDGEDPLEVERKVLGFDHAELGARLAEFWRLPAVLVEAIRCHHLPEQAAGAELRLICDAVKVGEGVAHALGARGAEPETPESDLAGARSRLGLTPEGEQELQELVVEKLDATLALYE